MGLGVSLSLSWLREESAACRLCVPKLTLPARLPGPAAALLAQPWPAASFPKSLRVPCRGASSPTPTQHCPVRNTGGVCSAWTGNGKYYFRNHASVAEKAFLSLFHSVLRATHV